MSDIILHPTKGVNAHLTKCVQCGEDGQDLLMLGRVNKIYKCNACNAENLDHVQPAKCARCGERGLKFVRELDDGERIPSGLCKKCEDEAALHRKEVEAGGVYFQCKSCGARGVIKAATGYAKKLRAHLNKPAPEAFGVELEECPNCHGNGQ